MINAGTCSGELPNMRRSRSLSELPGNLRVPILQRKDSERTKARLEAGAAGVKELRALREQQQELIDQAMAAAQPKWKQPTLQRHGHSLTDHHRVHQHHGTEPQQQQQANNNCSSPLSTWHSAYSLASISEERDQTLNISANTMGHSLSDDKKTKLTQLRYSHQKRNETIQSQDLYRARSQSVHGDFTYLPGAKGNECEHTKSPSSLRCSDNNASQGYDLPQSIDVGVTDRRCRANSMNVYTSISDREAREYQTPSRRYSLRASSQSMSWDNLLAVIGLQGEKNNTANEPMEQDGDKSDDLFTEDNAVSQENTKYLAGQEYDYSQKKKVRSQSFTSGHSIHPDSKFRPVTTTSLSPRNQKRIDSSSCTGNINDPNVQAVIVNGNICKQKKQTFEKVNSVSLLRRASIQCEAVLTQTSTPKKILNPLQDVDINSLRCPGPLHAVTLQYSSMPMRELSTSMPMRELSATKPTVASSIRSIPGDNTTLSNTNSLHAEVRSSSASTTNSRRYNSITESDYKPTSVSPSKQFKHENSRVNVPEPCHAEVTIKTTSNEHPIPKPRTSILKELPSQEASSQVNSRLTNSANRKHKMTLEILQQSTLQKTSNSNHTESWRNKELKSVTMSCFRSDNKIFDRVTACEVEKITHPQSDLATQKDCSSSEKTTQDFKGKTDNKRNLSLAKSVPLAVTDQNIQDHVNSPKGRSQTQSNPIKKHHQTGCSNLVLSPKSQPFHARDVSVLSDEGYSTCDSTSSPQSQLSSAGSLQSCVTGSLNSGSLANINGSLSFSPAKDRASNHTNCQLAIAKNCIKDERNCQNIFSNCTKESTKTKGLTETNKPQPSDDHCNKCEHRLCDNLEDKLLQCSNQTRDVMAQPTYITNQQTATTSAKMCLDKVTNTTDKTVAKTERWSEYLEEVVPMLTRSNNSMKGTDATKMFKQTSV